MPPERKHRQQGRKNSYSNRVHSVGEMSRREQRKQRKADLRQALNPDAQEGFEVNPNPSDMEPGEGRIGPRNPRP